MLFLPHLFIEELYSELSAGADAEAVQLEPADAAAGGSDAPARGGGFAAFTPRSQQARLFYHYLPVFRTHDNLVWIRIHGSMTKGSRFWSGYGSGSCSYRHWPSRLQQKTKSCSAYYLLKVHLHHFSNMKSPKEVTKQQCCGSGMFIPDPGSDFFPSRIPDPNCLHPGSSSKNLSILTPKKSKKMVSKLEKIWSGLFIPDPGSWCWLSPIPDPGSRGQKGTQSRIPDPDPQHCKTVGIKVFLLFCLMIEG